MQNKGQNVLKEIDKGKNNTRRSENRVKERYTNLETSSRDRMRKIG